MEKSNLLQKIEKARNLLYDAEQDARKLLSQIPTVREQLNSLERGDMSVEEFNSLVSAEFDFDVL